jgi:hypothetical protein
MRKIGLIFGTIALMFYINACEPEYKNKGKFANGIPKCIKQSIKKDRVIIAEEYCASDGIKKIYRLIMEDVIWKGKPAHWPDQMYDENCNRLMIDTEEFAWNPAPECGDLVVGYLFPNGTIEYNDVIYSFKRIVFTQK